MRDKRRLIEWGKNVLIALLTLSAVFLLTMTPLIQDSGLADLFRPQRAAGSPDPIGAPSGTVLPARLAVYRDGERYGLQYDDVRMDEAFASFGPLLGSALAEAGESRTLTETEWRGCLRGQGVYFDFSGSVPISALARWLGGSGECALDGSARRVVLAEGEGDSVALCWQDAEDGAFYTCPTTLSRSLHLDPAVEAVTPNGAYFAFEDAELSQLLDPGTLVTEEVPSGTQYAVSAPLSAAAGIETLLDELSFNRDRKSTRLNSSHL